MHIVCLGLSHRTAPVDVREKLALPPSEIGPAAARLSQVPGLTEAVIVATCNRVELYAATDDPARGFGALAEFVEARRVAVEPEMFFQLPTPQAVRHLFRVSCGLDSMVLGETEILGQVKKAYQDAHASGATSRSLNKLFQRAFNVAKEVRTKTNITRGAVSVGSVAVGLAERIFGNLKQCTVMILGAGETSEMTAGALRARGVRTIFVANRSYDRAVALAASMNGKAVHFEEWPREFREVDILIGSTAAPHHVLTREKLGPVMQTRPDRPLFCIDLAVPRDIEPAVNDLDGVYLYDIDSLQAIAERSMDVRRQELVVCDTIIERHGQEFVDWLIGTSVQSPRICPASASGAQLE